MEFGYWIGWCGVALGLAVPIPQLVSILRTKKLADVSLGTYTFLVGCLLCYLIHAIYISAEVFVCAQAVNLGTNGTIFVLLLRDRIRNRRRKNNEV